MKSSESIEILPVALTDRNRIERFLKVPWYIYREHYPSPHWVPPILSVQRQFLNPHINPFFEHAECSFWIAQVGNRDVGRIVAVDDADWVRVNGDKTGYFGFFECPNEPEIAHALLNTAFNWLKQRGMKGVIGPLNLSTNHQSGLLVDGFDSPPGIEMPFNPRYYEDLLKTYGLKKHKDLWQWRIHEGSIPARVEKLSQRVKTRNRIRIRTMDIKNWDAEINRMLEIYNDAWIDLWGFVPLSEKELRYIAANLKRVIHPNLALVAELEGQPVAVCITIMDINPLLQKLNGRLFPTGLFRLFWDIKVRQKINSGRLIIAGIKNGYRQRGIGSIMYVETHKAITKLGWKYADIGWTLEDNNDVNSAIESMEGKKIKTFRIYSKAC